MRAPPPFTSPLQLGNDAVAHVFELRAACVGDGLGGLLRNAERVDGRAVFPDAVVEVRTGRGARAAHVADQLAPCDTRTPWRDALA